MSRIIDVAIKRLSDSSCSEYELRRYLEEEFSSMSNLDTCIDSTIKQLRESHLVNDLRLALNLAQRYAHKGNSFITQVLAQKGIAEAAIAAVLQSLENENVRALDEARKKLGGQWDSSEKAMTLLHRFLSGRKFPYAVITTVIRQLGEQRRCSIN
ncbi:recombination regulator RecX [Legionella massiliensis]|uniref:Recombination regulator RecX n=1 Tax=Legionella massiliensis TaxID=1034943 RepID=A0A078KX01_9GAMM|nr:regulatory protein RecX [Legionella massiliensis]CDZ76258.1 recombination regulator RecX [Legionella massiliensis]CEE11996.1 Regulatory protein RecX [Legionella massiliensis]